MQSHQITHLSEKPCLSVYFHRSNNIPDDDGLLKLGKLFLPQLFREPSTSIQGGYSWGSDITEPRKASWGHLNFNFRVWRIDHPFCSQRARVPSCFSRFKRYNSSYCVLYFPGQESGNWNQRGREVFIYGNLGDFWWGRMVGEFIWGWKKTLGLSWWWS